MSPIQRGPKPGSSVPLSGQGQGPTATPRPAADPKAIASRTGQQRLQFLKTQPGILASSLILLLVLYAVALYYLQPDAPGREVSLNAVVSAAPAGRLPRVTFLDEDARITGRIVLTEGRPAVRFWTSYPRSDAATNDLLKGLLSAGTLVTVDSQSSKAIVRFVAQFLLPLVILADLFALLFFLSKGAGAGEFKTFSQLGDRRQSSEAKRRTTFADVAAADEALAELAEVRDYLADPSAFTDMGAQPPKGILLVGPPGCGKTLLGRAVAGEARAAFFSISGSEFVESLVGVGAARVRDLFAQARACAPAILFIDELDAVGRQRGAGLGGGHDEREQTLNELLVQMDGFTASDGVLVLGATNRADILDPALLRPGRFDRQIVVDLPDRGGRLSILRLHAKGKKLADPEADLAAVAALTPGFTGAHLAAALNEAALLAVRERATRIDRKHLDEAVERVVAGPRRKGAILTAEEKRHIAIHESGHAVVAASLGQIDGLSKVSVIARGRGIGHLTVLNEGKLLPRRRDMEAQIAIAMAGVAAEEIAFGEPSTGSEADLERATNAARDMAGRYGMSPRLGRVRVLREHREIFLGRDYLHARDVSQPTLEHLDAEVRRILDEQEARARAILSANEPVHDALTAALTTNETVAGADLTSILASVVAAERIRVPSATPNEAAPADTGPRRP